MLKKHLYVITSLSCGKKFTIQKCEARCHTATSVTNYLNGNVLGNIRKQNWSPYSCVLSLLDYAICDIMKKILYKDLKQYENIEGPSAAMSYVWDNSSIIQWISGRCDYSKWQKKAVVTLYI